jgi:hypothetical protein
MLSARPPEAADLPATAAIHVAALGATRVAG